MLSSVSWFWNNPPGTDQQQKHSDQVFGSVLTTPPGLNFIRVDLRKQIQWSENSEREKREREPTRGLLKRLDSPAAEEAKPQDRTERRNRRR